MLILLRIAPLTALHFLVKNLKVVHTLLDSFHIYYHERKDVVHCHTHSKLEHNGFFLFSIYKRHLFFK